MLEAVEKCQSALQLMEEEDEDFFFFKRCLRKGKAEGVWDLLLLMIEEMLGFFSSF
jgi:hypothetical protein